MAIILRPQENMNRLDLTGRIAVVTGGARGIGFAIARRLLESGASCALWDRDETAAAAAVKSLSAHGPVNAVTVDLTLAESVQAARDATLRAWGRVDLLVNNAGIAGAAKKTWELSPDEWQQVLQVNLFGVFLCCRALVPDMLSRGYGRIVNIASIAGKEGNPNASHYSATKAGVMALTKSLGKELAQSGILVNCITPAVIQTEILQQVTPEHVAYMLSKIPMGRFGRVEEAAALVAWLCSDECSFSTGAVFDLSGGRATY
jgi:3-oxoacyl-[acyl-carrier protein] reductase